MQPITSIEILFQSYVIMSELPTIQNLKCKRMFVNQTEISHHLYCCICHDVFSEPVRTICGHTFCYVCIQQWASIKKECPVCKHSIIQRKLQKDLLATAIIDDLKVRCVHNGCNWTSVQALRREHQRRCPYKPKNKAIPESCSIDIVQVGDVDEGGDSDIEIIESKER